MTDHRLIQENIPLAPLTTLRIGGPARFFAEARSENKLIDSLGFAEDRRLPVLILGGGSNVLIADEGFPGLVARVAMKGIEWLGDGEQVIVAAGEDWDDFVRQCVERKLAGVECLSGIPGSAGGTPVQNVGAYGQEVSETIVSVKVFDRHTREIKHLSWSQCNFNYRASIFNTTDRDRYIVLSVTYALKPRGEPTVLYPDLKNFFMDITTRPTLGEVREGVRMIRSRKAMLLVPGDPDCRSAGSFFKNPVVTREMFERVEEAARVQGLIGIDERVPGFAAGDSRVKLPAAWLIERAGFHKGFRRGRAGISSKHTLAIINLGGATTREVLGLVREIQEQVREKFGISLEPEPVFVGI